MTNSDRPKDKDESKLRRWVANLQLESWQLELLITGFSIFLLATGIGEYNDINRNIQENKLNPGANGINPLLSISINFILDTIPIGMKFFLINLLIHLLLRGFWIGIVGLSSVSNFIDYDKLGFKGKFRKYMPENVRSLDELIVHLDKISSVIFAYTFLLVFSIVSVVIVFAIGVSLMSLTVILSTASELTIWIGVLNLLAVFLVIFYFILAIIFFLDTLFFSAFKKSKWFSFLYYPIYRFFSVITLSILYRSIYYHLITTYKKKQIIGVSSVLLVVLLITLKADALDVNVFYPERTNISERYMVEELYDDLRAEDQFIHQLSLPSKYVKNGFLELFLRYNPKDNGILELLCPDSYKLSPEGGVMQGFKAGMQAQMDTTLNVDDLMRDKNYESRLVESIACQTQIFEVYIDGMLYSNLEYVYKTHISNGEKGYLAVIDVLELGRGKHLLEVKKLKAPSTARIRGVEAADLKMESMSVLNFWIE
ncbi:hypothetical protein [Roseivirga echinicomitans]|uniref:Uncharacterized protein n=1 Tax=Roseivirga echinicomitans TaxID=296218 RepID=A0A150XV98_9BACT|nr:hypothetical protein [Roseivirga echinicomitans]KYG82670.1 hypothetical protein AWN68_12825 [Roseivirga echinicomitans]